MSATTKRSEQPPGQQRKHLGLSLSEKLENEPASFRPFELTNTVAGVRPEHERAVEFAARADLSDVNGPEHIRISFQPANGQVGVTARVCTCHARTHNVERQGSSQIGMYLEPHCSCTSIAHVLTQSCHGHASRAVSRSLLLNKPLISCPNDFTVNVSQELHGAWQRRQRRIVLALSVSRHVQNPVRDLAIQVPDESIAAEGCRRREVRNDFRRVHRVVV